VTDEELRPGLEVSWRNQTVVFLGIHADTVAVQTLSRACLGYFRVVVSDATSRASLLGCPSPPRI
jgi:hypothetical protein